MHTFGKYAAIAYLHKTGMPNQGRKRLEMLDNLTGGGAYEERKRLKKGTGFQRTD